MAEVFVDTVAWLALLNASDALHEPARQIMEQLRAQQVHLTTTEFDRIRPAGSGGCAVCTRSARSDHPVH